MRSIENPVVFNKLVESHRREAVHVDASVEHPGASLDKRPVIVTDVVMDMSVDHIPAP